VQFPADLTTISRRHAELVREGNRYKLIDRSANGTFVNGKKITEAFLKDGDVIMLAEGGPKVSFLAKITDAVQAELVSAPPAPEPVPAPKPVQAEPPSPKPQAPHAEPVIPAAPVIPPVPVHPAPPIVSGIPKAPIQDPPRPAAPARQMVQKVQAPLIVQFGPMLKSYKELPIVIGRKADADFVLNFPSIADQHAQIFFSANQYWVRDLTGRNLITINGNPIGYETPMKAQDILSLAPSGPSLRFLGEGRLAEYEEEQLEETPPEAVKPSKPEPAKKGKASKSIFDIFKK
jgi:pSer/pThr/pTyr-binding forkhead associated (FHA) protein